MVVGDVLTDVGPVGDGPETALAADVDRFRVVLHKDVVIAVERGVTADQARPVARDLADTVFVALTATLRRRCHRYQRIVQVSRA